MLRSAIGIDVGGTNLRAARVGAEGGIEARVRASSSRDPAIVLETMARLIDDLDSPEVAGVGLGIPGRVDFHNRRILSGGYVDLSGLAVAEILSARIGRPVVIDNDCSMALVAEAACGAARGCRSAVMLTIGTGIGGAAIEAGRILRGRGSAGQLGHVVVEENGLPCLCGRHGCVETTSSGTALGRHIAEAGLPADTTAADLLSGSRGNHAEAAAVIEAWALPLRRAIDGLVAALDPEIVLLGGGLGREAVAALARLPAVSSWYACPIVAAELGDDAGVIGAAIAALRHLSGSPKRVVLVNGVPASGKSTVSQALSKATGWPVLALDTVKNPFLDGIGRERPDLIDRSFNRLLGKASYQTIFSVLNDAPAGTTAIVDAWFGFQPPEVLKAHLAMAGITETVEIWCHASPETIGQRYADRLDRRLPGHPGAEYLPELMELAARAAPLRQGATLSVDTAAPLDVPSILRWLDRAWDNTASAFGEGWAGAGPWASSPPS